MSTSSNSRWPLVGIAVAVGAVAAAVIVMSSTGSDEPSRPASTEGAAPADEERRALPMENNRPPVAKRDRLAGREVARTPGPRRFVIRYGSDGPFRPDVEHRSLAEARDLAEAVRRRVLEGEDPGPIIREQSDPPVGLSRELVVQHGSLREGEASEVLDISNGFVVFFGRPNDAEPPAEPAAEQPSE